MRKIHSTPRLFFKAGLSIRAIARTLRVSPEVPAKAGMGDYIRRAKVAALSWPLPEGLDERVLEARLFPGAGVPAPAQRAMPDWAHVHAELRRKGVTLSLLWQEYKGEQSIVERGGRESPVRARLVDRANSPREPRPTGTRAW